MRINLCCFSDLITKKAYVWSYAAQSWMSHDQMQFTRRFLDYDHITHRWVIKHGYTPVAMRKMANRGQKDRLKPIFA